VDTAFEGHFVAKKSIDHSVAGRLHLGLEGLRGDDESMAAG
jgi:hypothetical protein